MCIYVCGYEYRSFCIYDSDPADSTCSLALLCYLCIISDLKSPVAKHPNPILPCCGYTRFFFFLGHCSLCTVHSLTSELLLLGCIPLLSMQLAVETLVIYLLSVLLQEDYRGLLPCTAGWSGIGLRSFFNSLTYLGKEHIYFPHFAQVNNGYSFRDRISCSLG